MSRRLNQEQRSEESNRLKRATLHDGGFGGVTANDRDAGDAEQSQQTYHCKLNVNDSGNMVGACNKSQTCRSYDTMLKAVGARLDLNGPMSVGLSDLANHSLDGLQD
eukprot:2537888-Amphidinium_carterae.1